jgi:hypothetical protein
MQTVHNTHTKIYTYGEIYINKELMTNSTWKEVEQKEAEVEKEKGTL